MLSRLEKALKEGWGFRHLDIINFQTGRHSMWVSKPDSEEWFVAKVSGAEEDSLEGLLNSAGVPKYSLKETLDA